jgi:putative ABC transport system permease protein
MRSYLKLALKVLSRRKVFTAISLFGITLTLAVLVIAVAVLDNIFAARTPEGRFDRVLGIYMLTMAGENGTMTSNPGYKFLHDHVRTIPGIENFSSFSNNVSMPIYKDGVRVDATAKYTDAAYWQILDFRFLEGHPFNASDDAAGRRVAIITDALRMKLFSGAPAAGRTISLNGTPFQIIGVVPQVSFTRRAGWSDVWVPYGSYPNSEFRQAFFGDENGLVLARSRSDIRRLQREFQTRLKRIPIPEKGYETFRAGLDTPFEAFARNLVNNRGMETATLRVAAMFVGGAILFMSLPALNLITLNLSRILERASEIGVRRAFGAPRRSLIVQFVIENVLLTLIGGLAAFLLATAILPLLSTVAPFPGARFEVSLGVFVYGMLIAAFFGVFSGVYPAWRMSRMHPVTALRGGAE